MARLFFAIRPDDRTRAALTDWTEKVHAVAGGRRTQPRNLHMTLAFLGETDLRRIEELEGAAGTVVMAPAVMNLERCTYWKHNRIVWAGGEAPPPLQAAAAQLRAALNATGIRFDSKPFLPHVSLLRNARAVASLPPVDPVPWLIREFVLMASGRDAAGPVYRVIAGPFGDGSDTAAAEAPAET